MAKYFFSVLFLISITVKGQTKLETVDWLISKLHSDQHIGRIAYATLVEDELEEFYLISEKISMSPYSITVTYSSNQKWRNGGSFQSTPRYERIVLSDITNVVAAGEGSMGRTFRYPVLWLISKEKSVPIIIDWSQENDLFNRVKKAFQHLISLNRPAEKF